MPPRPIGPVFVRPPESGPFCPRCAEPVTVGVPLARGAVAEVAAVRLTDARGLPVSQQWRVLDRWSDGSVRWALLDFRADVPEAAGARYEVVIEDDPLPTRLGTASPSRAEQGPATAGSGPASPATRPGLLAVRARENQVVVDTGVARWVFEPGGGFPFSRVELGERPLIASAALTARLADPLGDRRGPASLVTAVTRTFVERAGPLCASVLVEAELSTPGGRLLLTARARVELWAGLGAARVAVTVRNPHRARHPGGYWELGEPSSVLLDDLGLVLSTGAPVDRVRWSLEPGADMREADVPSAVHQESSGGEYWRSPVHLNAARCVPMRHRGYRFTTPDGVHEGLRATPLVTLATAQGQLAATLPQFWEQFPRALVAASDGLRVGIFPGDFPDATELQGGEQVTATVWLAAGADPVTDVPLAWARAPVLARFEPAHYAWAQAMDHLTTREGDRSPVYLGLVQDAIEGPGSFFAKRETIDEYGWRNFGELYADHETRFHEGPAPLVSHFNNQYDPILGFGIHFMRSGDARWWTLMRDLAQHVVDIDLYHTTEDKAAYNNGLFWHTAHYLDADISSHRSHARIHANGGGGPSPQHVYTSGLVLAYCLTGNDDFREAAIGLADFVIASDDGRRTPFRLLARGATGHASASYGIAYHGPGRGPGNSITALVDAHRLTGQARFLEKAEELIRRCVHPEQDLAALDLLDTERRWFYTVFFQAVGRYLEHKAEAGQLDETYAYARATLLHYARWMADHERPYLDRPEILEFPNETWDAQDLRKSVVLRFAARHERGPDRTRFIERADFFFRHATDALAATPLHVFARPAVLALGTGYRQAYFEEHPDELTPLPAVPARDFGRHAVFVPQRLVALRRAKALLVAAAGGAALVVAALLWWALKS